MTPKALSREDELIEELKKLGWHYAYLCGHGDTEAISEVIDGESYVVGDIEKSQILVPPSCIWEEKVKSNNYY